MTLFWIVTVVLILIAAAIFVVPIFGKPQDDIASRDELNKAFFKDRITELENESSEGLVNNRDELVTELQQSLLDDVPANSEEHKSEVSPLMLLPGVVLLVAVCYGMYFSVGNIGKVESWHQTVAQLPELTQRLMDEQGAEPLSDAEMTDLTLALRTRLHETPDDATGWLLLGRIGMANRDASTADGAMRRAYALDPENPEVQLSYAQSLMMMGNPQQIDFARQLLRSVIRQDHTNLRAMSLLAFDAFENGEYSKAVSYWTMMKQMVGEDDPRAEMLERSIERARSQVAQESNIATTVSVEVALDPTVKLPSEGLVIVSVHSADGAPMPVAARRIPLSQFPISLTMTDNDSMIPERLMSSLPEMVVKARIDTDGNVMTKKGDWYGQSDVVTLGGSTKIVINAQY
ncbi:Cytochrome c heme lyase subunit CcmH [Photobacterium marinum]|uniref:Cytochrome c heme lyase subunit CcmH n=1 Tax=Photobacterium marinum TaxID=1056511 RepID=L8J8D7_9GAMM|nr:c-type cytochrome biogenesis protein CcmI [Photobacterium marinum]ELR65076.1 Cytochrome c heme lyase subunit CcmH [Photobacterium marinum]